MKVDEGVNTIDCNYLNHKNKLISSAQVVIKYLLDHSPIADFSITADTMDAPSLIEFDASSSSSEDKIVSYIWDYGDGIVETHSSPNHHRGHLYMLGGNYTAKLVVRDENGRMSKRKEMNIIVNTVPNRNPIIEDFHYYVGPERGCEYGRHRFMIDASDPDYQNLIYTWTINGEYYPQNPFYHAFDYCAVEPGRKYIKFFVSDFLGGTTIFVKELNL